MQCEAGKRYRLRNGIEVFLKPEKEYHSSFYATPVFVPPSVRGNVEKDFLTDVVCFAIDWKGGVYGREYDVVEEVVVEGGKLFKEFKLSVDHVVKNMGHEFEVVWFDNKAVIRSEEGRVIATFIFERD